MVIAALPSIEHRFRRVESSPHALEPYPRHLLERLEHWAARTPERPLLAQRDRHGGWRTLSYRDALAKVRAFFEAQPRERGFGNGRLARNLFEAMVARQSSRLVGIVMPRFWATERVGKSESS